MSKRNYHKSVARHKRVQRVKGLTTIALMILILIPFVLCVLLFVRVHDLNEKLESTAVQLQNLTYVTREQQEQLQQIVGSVAMNQEVISTEQTESDMENLTDKDKEPGISTVPDENVDLEKYKHKVYLTFDDGPGQNTEDILAILDKYNVKATFFVVGKDDEYTETVLNHIVDGGHTIGLHSYSHKYNEIYQSVEAFAADFTRLQNYVYEVTGVKSNVYRFPGGSSNTVSDLSMHEFADYLESQGVEYFDWNISSGDGSSRLLDAQTIVENCTRDIQKYGTSIILMHDSAEKTTTLEALPVIIEKILAMEDTVILPITEETKPVRHLDAQTP